MRRVVCLEESSGALAEAFQRPAHRFGFRLDDDVLRTEGLNREDASQDATHHRRWQVERQSLAQRRGPVAVLLHPACLHPNLPRARHPGSRLRRIDGGVGDTALEKLGVLVEVRLELRLAGTTVVADDDDPLNELDLDEIRHQPAT